MTFQFSCVIVGCFLVTFGSCQDTGGPTKLSLTDDRTSLAWVTTDPNSILVTADEGYQIQVDAVQIDVDGENNEYVTIKSIDDDGEESDALMFTYTVSGKPSYLYNNNRVQADYVGTNENNTFLIQFTRVGEPATTTSEPQSTTTTQAMPTAAPDEDPTLTRYIYRCPLHDYTVEYQRLLKESIAKMAKDYCNIQNCPLNGTITYNNVKITLLDQCPITWENHENCVVISFSLPIVKPDNYKDKNPTWAGYQLNENHLGIMWDDYAEKYLNEINLSPYDEPNIDKIFTSRLLVACFVILILIIFIAVLQSGMNRVHKKRRKLSDTLSIRNQPSKINNHLDPHYLQELPPLFSNDFPLYTEQSSRKLYEYTSTFADDNESHMQPEKINIQENDDENSEVEA